MEPDNGAIVQLRKLYSQGQYIQAWHLAQRFAPLRQWQGVAARLIGGRLAMQLGAPRLGRQLHLLAWRHSPGHPEAIYYQTRYLLERFGPVSAWRFARRQNDWSVAAPQLQADWWALMAVLAARFRDWDRAQQWLDKAEQLAPHHPWPLVERATVYEMAERYTEGLAAARRALEIRPWYRPAVQAAAQLLFRLGQPRQALELLCEAAEHLECGLIAAQCAALHYELEQYTEGLAVLDRFEALSPLLEKEGQQWLLARRVDMLLRLGRVAEATTLARAVTDEFYQHLADRLASGTLSQTVPTRLTLYTGLCWPPLSPQQFLERWWWQLGPTPARDTAAPSASDGLLPITIRQRWEQSGWLVRDFRLDVETATRLIQRRCPFFVHIFEPGYFQSRLVVGCDPLRHTLLLPDPEEGIVVEAPLSKILQQQVPFGPWATVHIPHSAADCLRDLPLPDAPAYDALVEIQSALHQHDRYSAGRRYEQLRRDYPDHQLLLLAELAIAHYDASPVRILECYDRWLQRYPGQIIAIVGKAVALRELQRHEEHLQSLRDAHYAAPSEPLLLFHYAQALMTRSPQREHAAWLLHRALRLRPTTAAGHFLLATIAWESQRFHEALDHYRFACTLDQHEQQFAEAYARTSLALGQTHEALRLFQNRGPRATTPQATATRALYWLLCDRGQQDHAWIALDQTLQKLARAGLNDFSPPQAPPEPATSASGLSADLNAASEPLRARRQTYGELLLFRAEQHAAAGRFAQAYDDLQAARPYVGPVQWPWSAARVARCVPDLRSAAEHLQQLTRLRPFDIEAQRLLLSLLSETAGPAAVRARLEWLCQQYPHHYPLLKLRAEFYSHDADADGIAAVQAVLQQYPNDASSWRQLALLYLQQKRFPEADQALQRAVALEPHHPANAFVQARLLQRLDRVAQARETVSSALRHNIDQEPLIQLLLQLSRGQEEKQAALSFLAAELCRQPHTGEGLVAFLNQSLQLMTEQPEPDPDAPQRLLEALQAVLEARPDLWYAWSMVIGHLGQLHHLEQAEVLARSAVERFPLVSKLWLDLAQVYHDLDKHEERLEALRQAMALAPGWLPPIQGLVEALHAQGDHEEAVSVCTAALTRNPLDGTLHALCAHALWEANRASEALSRMQMALRHDPTFEPGWQMLQHWAMRLEQPEVPVALARELTQLRPGNPDVWLRLARLLGQPAQAEDALAALDRALALDPRRVEAYDLKAERLTELGRYEEALAAARPPLLANHLPLVLQGRAAWIEARRGNYAAAIPPMQALVVIEPRYFWGWLQLAEWYNATDQKQQYLEAANQLVRLQPDHPNALVMRGEARMKMGDREGAKADLREALRIAPSHSLAAALLFDICLAEGHIWEARQALALLQEHMTGPAVALKQLQLAVHMHDPETALRAFSEICESTDTDSYLLYRGWSELESAGWSESAHKLLRQAWQSGGPFHPWVPILWVQSPHGQKADPAEQLRALEVLTQHYPRFAPGYDAKAELLARLGRYPEALATCQPADWSPPPPELQLRAAWIEAHRGRLAVAIQRMQQLLQQHPNEGHYWLQLAEWYALSGNYRQAYEAAEQAIGRNPRLPLSYLVRGHIRRQLGERRGARSDYQQALELDPTLEEAAVSLIGILLDDNDVAEALQVYTHAAAHHDKPWMRLRFLQIACHQGDREAALTRLHLLVREADTSLEILREAARSFDQQHWTQTLMTELKEIVFDSRAVPAIAVVWVERLLEAGQQQQAIDLLPQLRRSHSAAARLALLTLLEGLAERQLPLHGLVTHHADLLRADTQAWAVAGRALAASGQYAHAAAWLADWRTRPDLTPQMLLPLAQSYRLLDQDQRAADVCYAALQLAAPDVELTEFIAWGALEAALARRPEEAAQLLARLESVNPPPKLLPLNQITRSLLLVFAAGPQGRSLAFREARQLLRQARSHLHLLPGLLRAYRRAVRLLSHTVATPLARCWAWWQLLRTYL
jgi:tetratricopeptide (TPR) repeat protein